MATINYQERRGQLQTYFDRTAVDAWARLTSTAPVSRIRATVRAGRDEMRSTLLGFLPDDLSGKTLLDAGCGTGALSVEAAKRGADVVAVDLSPTLVKLGGERLRSVSRPFQPRGRDGLIDSLRGGRCGAGAFRLCRPHGTLDRLHLRTPDPDARGHVDRRSAVPAA
jgi:magnesium-protoporphyrin O-methyltransferase